MYIENGNFKYLKRSNTFSKNTFPSIYQYLNPNESHFDSDSTSDFIENPHSMRRNYSYLAPTQIFSDITDYFSPPIQNYPSDFQTPYEHSFNNYHSQNYNLSDEFKNIDMIEIYREIVSWISPS